MLRPSTGSSPVPKAASPSSRRLTRRDANCVNFGHNDLNDNSGRVRCRELLTKNLRNFGREVNFTEAEGTL